MVFTTELLFPQGTGHRGPEPRYSFLLDWQSTGYFSSRNRVPPKRGPAGYYSSEMDFTHRVLFLKEQGPPKGPRRVLFLQGPHGAPPGYYSSEMGLPTGYSSSRNRVHMGPRRVLFLQGPHGAPPGTLPQGTGPPQRGPRRVLSLGCGALCANRDTFPRGGLRRSRRVLFLKVVGSVGYYPPPPQEGWGSAVFWRPVGQLYEAKAPPAPGHVT